MLRHLLMLGVAIGAAGQALHNTKELNLDQTPSGGCSYDNSHLIEYSNIGSMTWAGCVTAASEYGLMMTSGFYTVRGGWLGLRVGSKAMIESNYNANPCEPTDDSCGHGPAEALCARPRQSRRP